MRSYILILSMIALSTAPCHVARATQASKAMEVSFTILARCTVHPHNATKPLVICAHADGFMVLPKSNDPSGKGWTVYF